MKLNIVVASALVANLGLAIGSDIPVSYTEPFEIKTEDFESTIAQGTWWIDFFSPYCPHCTHLAPFWNETSHILQDEGSITEHGFHMAKVNCVTDGDLCDREGIAAYPTLKLYKDGKFVEKYGKVEKTTQDLLEYAHNIMKTDSADENKGGDNNDAESSEQAKDISDSSHNNELSKYLNYTQFLEVSGSGDPWLIKFYSPRCPHCTKMAPEWKRVAGKLNSKLKIGEVNCDREQALCKHMEIKRIPDIYYFHGPAKAHYTGRPTFEEMKAFAESRVNSMDIEEVNTLNDVSKAAKKAKSKGIVSTIVYVYDEGSTEEDWNALKRVAIKLAGKVQFVKSGSKDSTISKELTIQRLPSIQALLPRGSYDEFPNEGPADIRNVNKVSEWAERNWLFNVPELEPNSVDQILGNTDYVVIGLKSKDRQQDADPVEVLELSAVKYNADNARRVASELDSQREAKQKKIDAAVERGDEDAEELAKKIKVQAADKPTVGFVWVNADKYADWITTRFGSNVLEHTQVVINSDSRGLYWDDGLHGSGIKLTIADVTETLDAILMASARMHSRVLFLGLTSAPKMLCAYVATHKAASLFVLLIVLLVANRRRRRMSRSARQVLPLSNTGKLE